MGGRNNSARGGELASCRVAESGDPTICRVIVIDIAKATAGGSTQPHWQVVPSQQPGP